MCLTRPPVKALSARSDEWSIPSCSNSNSSLLVSVMFLTFPPPRYRNVHHASNILDSELWACAASTSWEGWGLSTSAGRYWGCSGHLLCHYVIDVLQMFLAIIAYSTMSFTVVSLWSTYLDGRTLKYALSLIAGIASGWSEMHCGIPSSPKFIQVISGAYLIKMGRASWLLGKLECTW